ncbi:MAG TPA: selenium cofactor biosynthesis protein YqeC [Myxococcota bacterium]|nr:selenium cofactor biosynthesis protein YqeC [Myxococcota bacterium]
MSEQHEAADVAAALGLAPRGELVAIVGGGGKTSLLFALAQHLPGRGVMTTTTRIFAAQRSRAAEVCTLDDDWRARLDAFDSALLVVGRIDGERALGVPADLPAELLAHPRVDWVIVEADGSRMRPVKAPAEHEPVIPVGTTLLVIVVGIDALGKPIGEIAHRPERVSALTGLDPAQHLTPLALARLLTSREGGLKNASAARRAAILINKVESAAELAAAREIARHAIGAAGVERVAIGALLGSDASRWRVYAR